MVHHGQFGEDIAVQRLFPSKYRGFYVDVGCYHPLKYSNTYALYRRGWGGINIDIDMIKIEGFKLLRRHDVNIACAVSDQSGEIEYYSAGFFSLINTLQKNFTDERTAYKLKRAPARRLDEIIDGTRYRGVEIDFLSVDTEAHDLRVLASLDFDRYRPKVVAVESHATTLDDLMEQDLFKFLRERGYMLANWCGLTLIFRHGQWEPGTSPVSARGSAGRIEALRE